MLLSLARRPAAHRRPPGPPYVLNRDCLSAEGLVAFWPLGAASGHAHYDIVGRGASKLTQNGTMAPAPGPYGEGLAASNTGSASNFLSTSVNPVVTPPFTIAAWVYTTQTASYWNAWAVSFDGTNYHNIYINYPSAGNVGANTFDGLGQESQGTATKNLTTNTWAHITCTWTSNVLRAAFVDGGNKGSNTTSLTPTTPTLTTIGQFPGGFGPMTGRIAHVCAWNRVLSDDAVARLYDPATRWELYWQSRGRFYSFASEAPLSTLKTNSLMLMGIGR